MGAGATVHSAGDHGLGPLLAVHDGAFLAVLEQAYERWVADGHLEDPGAPYATPYFFPAVGGRHGGDPRRPAAANAAVTAAELVLEGSDAAYAICRPPGHHAGPAFFGGSCYLNNSAIAAARLRAGGVARVAVLDLDAHHGNGTQACFWDDPAVCYASLHVNPGEGWFPHTVGYADEIDATATNWNLPLAPGTGDDGWLTALGDLIAVVERFASDALVVSLGVDAAREDPNSPLQVTTDGFAAAGRRIGTLGRPTVVVHEGGYVLDTLAQHTLAFLQGL